MTEEVVRATSTTLTNKILYKRLLYEVKYLVVSIQIQ